MSNSASSARASVSSVTPRTTPRIGTRGARVTIGTCRKLQSHEFHVFALLPAASVKANGGGHEPRASRENAARRERGFGHAAPPFALRGNVRLTPRDFSIFSQGSRVLNHRIELMHQKPSLLTFHSPVKLRQRGRG